MPADRRLRRTQRALGDAPQDAASWLRAARDLERAGLHLRAQHAALRAACLQRDDPQALAGLQELGVHGLWVGERGGPSNRQRASLPGPRQGVLQWRRDLPRRPTGALRVDLQGRAIVRAKTAGLLRVSLDGHSVEVLGDWPAEVPPNLGPRGPCGMDTARLATRGPGELRPDTQLASFSETTGWRFTLLPAGVLAQGPAEVPLWRQTLAHAVELATADEGPLYVALRGGQVLALDRGTGEPRWERPARGGRASVAVADDGALVARQGSWLACWEPDGTARWSLELVGVNDPALGPDRVLVTSSVAGTRCLDLQTGASRWHRPQACSERGPLLDADGWTYLVEAWRGLTALDPDGELGFSARLGGAGPPSPPALGWDGRAYVTAGPSLVAVG